jgi:hypothetical protein
MSISSTYTFNHGDRIGADATYNTQQNIQNANHAKYNLANYHSDNLSQDIIYFASQNPSMIANGSHRGSGSGLGSKNVDVDSKLHLGVGRERSIERIDLRQRMFLTVPYLGRGAGNVPVETKLQWGDAVPKRQPVRETTHEIYAIHPNDKMRSIMNKSEHISDKRVGLNSRYEK